MTVVDKTSVDQKTVDETPRRPQLDRIEERRKETFLFVTTMRRD